MHEQGLRIRFIVLLLLPLDWIGPIAPRPNQNTANPNGTSQDCWRLVPLVILALHARKYRDIPNDIQVVTKGPRRLVVQEEEKKSTESWFLL